MAAQRNEALDGLRGYAALMVTFYHGILHFDLSLIDRVLYRRVAGVEPGMWLAKLMLIIGNGETAVIVFFVLSGLVLRGALDRLSARPFADAAVIFAGRRLWRIYPAVVVTMVLFMSLSKLATALALPHFPAFAWQSFWDNVTLYSPAMHGPSWSVQVELCAVPFLLGAEWLRRRLGVLGLLLAFGFALLAIDYPSLIFDLPALHPYLFMFFLGMLLYEPAVASAVRGLHPASTAVALLMFIVARHITERGAISGLILQGLLGGLLVACVAYRHDSVTRFFAARFGRHLGRISYSFYLLNVPALYVVWAVIETYVPDPGHHALRWGVISALTATALTWPLAGWCADFVEQPAIRIGRRMFPTREPAMSGSAAGAGLHSAGLGDV